MPISAFHAGRLTDASPAFSNSWAIPRSGSSTPSSLSTCRVTIASKLLPIVTLLATLPPRPTSSLHVLWGPRATPAIPEGFAQVATVCGVIETPREHLTAARHDHVVHSPTSTMSPSSRRPFKSAFLRLPQTRGTPSALMLCSRGLQGTWYLVIGESESGIR